MKNRSFASPLVLCVSVVVLALLSSFYLATPRVSALTTAQLKALGSATPGCQATAATAVAAGIPASSAGKEAIAECGTGYAAGFQDTGPAKTDAAIAKLAICNFSALTDGPAACVAGYKLGQAAASAAVSQAIPAGSTPTTAQITSLGQADPTCSVLKGPVLAGQLVNGPFNACVDGFVAGFKAGPTAAAQATAKTAACGTSAFKAQCRAGFDAGVFDKQVAGTNAAAAAAAAAAATAGSPATATADKQLGCDFSVNPLTWFICPVVDTLVEAVKTIDKIITDRLTINTDQIFCASTDSTCHAYYTAWQQFRNISLGLIVIAGLVAVAAQALGTELLDAYTIRKTLPRILIAAVGVSVSWPLMQFAVTLSNDLGTGVRHLIYAPFAGLPDTLHIDLSFGGGAVTNIFFGTVATGAAAVGAVPLWIGLGGVGVLLSYAATAGLAVLIAILVLILREIAITLLIILAPVGIICYVLPNTQRYYKFWWEAFSKALLMFPLIAAFIASGRIFSAIAISAGGPVNGLIGFGAYFAPYFLIPLTFKFAGGALRGIGGFVNDRGRGGFDRLKNYRKESGQERRKRIRTGGTESGLYRPSLLNKNPFTGKAFKNNRSLGRALNTIGSYGLDTADMSTIKLGGTKLGAPIFGRNKGILEGKIAHEALAQSQKAAEILGLHYHAGNAVAGEFEEIINGVRETDGDEAANHLEAELVKTRGIVDKDGNFKGFRHVVGKEDAVSLAHTLQGYHDETGFHAYTAQGANIAAAQIEAKEDEIGNIRESEETRRADMKTVGLMTAASQGRATDSQITRSREEYIDANGGVDSGGFATNRMVLLQRMSQLRPENAVGHMEQFVRDENAVGGPRLVARSVYQDPMSAAAQKSVERLKNSDIEGAKSEMLDVMDQSLIYAASEHEMKMGPNQTLERTGAMKDMNDENRAKVDAARAKIKYWAQYNVGDFGTARKVKDIAIKAGMDPNELVFGGNLSPEERARLAASGNEPADPFATEHIVV